MERLSWHVTCPNHASFCLLTIARRGSKEVGLVPQFLVIGLLLQVGDVARFRQALGFESLDLLLRFSKQGLCLTATEEEGGGKIFS